MKILEIGKVESYEKGDHLLWQGHRCKELYFVKEGVLRLFYLNDGFEITELFGMKNSFLTAVESYHHQTLSDQFIQAVVDTQVVRILKVDLEKAMEEFPELKDEYISIITAQLLHASQRLKSLQAYTAIQRYENLMDSNPELVNLVKRDQIASYLCVSNATLFKVIKNHISSDSVKSRQG